MSDRIQSLFSELEQICEQYKQQVPGRRRAWPKAIKDRIFELQALGVSGHQVSRRVPVPYMTIVSWRTQTKKKSAASFLPVAVREPEPRPPTVTVGGGKQKKPKSIVADTTVTTVTVVTPGGLRIEGLPVEAALRLLAVSRGGGADES